MSCNCEYGRCNQSFGCPVRAHPADGYIVPTGKPMPKECLKAGTCQADPCHCETLDKPIAQASLIGFWAGVLFWVCLAVFLTALCWQYPILLTQFF